ncbi:MAG: anthranilate/para-aminobenzoate synthase component [Actinomycetia bacterium]|nr:anthranilate/para-aminobenzoate synthase component [Actinomycetes bacterium]
MTSFGVDVVALVATLTPRPVTVVRDGPSLVIATDPDELVVANGTDAFDALDRAERAGFWTGYLAYDLGRAVEHVDTRAHDDLHLPDAVLARHDARIVCTPGVAPRVLGQGPVRRVLERALRAVVENNGATHPAMPVAHARWRSSLTRDEHASRVEEIKQLLYAGECYQVNLTRRLTLDQQVDPTALFAAVHERHGAPHEAFLAFDDTRVGASLVSASPELFLRVRDREVETQPIKGTAVDARTLGASAKDRAENVMIVDLARNDLGRVCVPGSVHVPSMCAVQAHPGLHHLVSTVRGRRRDDVTLGALVRATFPPASITGAPKPRVMQAIETLEPVRRGAYCGAIGWIDAERAAAEWSVAIRTFTTTAHQVHFGVGGGIVADSEPQQEWEETELKGARLLALLRAGSMAGGRA